MNVVISRTYGEKQTSGCLYVFDGDRAVFNCKTLELPLLGNKKKVSCIPFGVYDVLKYKRPSGAMSFWVQDVPDRTAILIHSGNYATGKKVDTEGCILPGLRFVDLNGDGNLDIADSQKAMDILLSILPQSFKLYIL